MLVLTLLPLLFHPSAFALVSSPRPAVVPHRPTATSCLELPRHNPQGRLDLPDPFLALTATTIAPSPAVSPALSHLAFLCSPFHLYLCVHSVSLTGGPLYLSVYIG